MSEFTEKDIRRWMNAAIQEAEKARAIDEVPIGAVVVKDGKIIGRGFNKRETSQQAAAHAEMIAIQEANETLGNWRLEDCHLFVTLEPCVMCSGAIVLARLKSIYYGPSDPKGGAVRTLMHVLEDERLNHQCEVHGGVMEEECRSLLTTFFKELRERKKKDKREK
ncbi:tRNA(adenine34) deaminase [Alkalibacterium subtropicum]|uniref:tRNA-specific adenosine deaminase n=1 Tax=Alkalibacterium subtropicum TaxID=753702 RepID=A0A1I1IKR5_9LACT|nr:tRNA adenosine(34) deaminase TadA [Alkalibacterium subtropicum]SFC36272.1 tRNA(adenine34) deaminase [Alkalibacterium subtropicum]